MDKSNLLILGLIGAAAIGAYLLFSNNTGTSMGSGSGGGGGGTQNQENPALPPNYIFNLPSPNFPQIDIGAGDLTYDQFTNQTPTKKTATKTPSGSYQGLRFIPKGMENVIPTNYFGPYNQYNPSNIQTTNNKINFGLTSTKKTVTTSKGPTGHWEGLRFIPN
jgi:hypothetical protein